MKKLVVLAAFMGIMIFGIVVTSGATIFTACQNLGFFVTQVTPGQTLFWMLATSRGYSVPYKTANNATLIITSYVIDANKDQIIAKGVYEVRLKGGDWWFFNQDSTTCNIVNVFPTGTAGSPLDAYFKDTATGWFTDLYVKDSTFALDYSNESVPATPPESATFLLLGSVLVGISLWGRWRTSL